MTDWNSDHPFDLGVGDNLGEPFPSYGEKPEGYLPPQLPIPPFVSQLRVIWQNGLGNV